MRGDGAKGCKFTSAAATPAAPCVYESAKDARSRAFVPRVELHHGNGDGLRDILAATRSGERASAMEAAAHGAPVGRHAAECPGMPGRRRIKQHQERNFL